MKKFKHSSSATKISAADIEENFSDLHPPLTAPQAVVESARCVYCYDAPCMNACPTRIDIPTFIHQIRSGNVEGSGRTILRDNIMGGTCARACPTEVLCEEVCVVNHTEGSPVKIGELQRHAVDAVIEQGGSHPFARSASSGKRLVVVGAGPAGLSFAHRSAMLGHDIIVYEAKTKPGGLNEYGLAAYKMANDFAQREVDFLLGVGGITIEYGKALGVELTLDQLRAEFDAVFFAAGLGTTRELGVPGEELNGVYDALNFIEDIRQSEDKTKIATGDNVIVIGGGNTAIDAAVQAKCLGAPNVTLVYRRGPEAMSATGWEQDLATANGVIMRYWMSPKEFLGDGKVERAVFSEMELKNGKLTPSGRDVEIPADKILKAIGQTLDDAVLSELKIEKGKIAVDGEYRTSLSRVFAGGDCINRGEDLTVQAVEDGKQAAIIVDSELRTAAKGAAR